MFEVVSSCIHLTPTDHTSKHREPGDLPMDSHSSVTALKRGCSHLRLPHAAAKELVRFLFVKRLVKDESGSELSPSAKVDSLWHWMLLETDVRDAVEALVGGKIKHTQATMHQQDDQKMERRLHTMEVMAREGWQPNLSLWEEPGTLLSEIAPVSVVPAGHAGEEFVKYSCVGKSIDSIVDQLTAQGYVVAQVRQEGDLDDPSRRRRRSHADAVRVPSLGRCTITVSPMSVYVKTLTGKTLNIPMEHPHKLVHDLKVRIWDREGVPEDQQRLIFGGREMQDGCMLAEHHVMHESTVHMCLCMSGC